MNVKDLLNRAKKERQDTVTIGEYEFELKILNELDVMNLALKQRNNGEFAFETSLVLNSVVNYKNVKVKDILSDCTDEEANNEVEFNREVLEIFLGRNQSVILELFKAVSSKMAEAEEKKNKQKKT